MYGNNCRSMSRRARRFGNSRWTWRALFKIRLSSDSARFPKCSICEYTSFVSSVPQRNFHGLRIW